MKSLFLKTAVLAALAVSLTACNGMTRTQRNTAAGAAIGGVAGNLIGGYNRRDFGRCCPGWRNRQPNRPLNTICRQTGRLKKFRRPVSLSILRIGIVGQSIPCSAARANAPSSAVCISCGSVARIRAV